MLFTQHSIQNALQDASRQLSTRQVLNYADFVESLCASAPVQDCATRINIRVMSAANFATLNNQLTNPLAVGPETTVFNAGEAGGAVMAVVTYDWELIFPRMEVFGNVSGSAIRRLVAVTAFQNEP